MIHYYTLRPGGVFKQVAKYLKLVGRNGIILNSDKFFFGEDTVDRAGTRLAHLGQGQTPPGAHQGHKGGPHTC